MKILKQLFAIACMALLFTACKNTDFKKTKEGFPYKIFSDGKGEKIVAGNVVRYHVTQKIKDSILGTTYGGQPNFIPIPKENIEHPLAKLLIEARKGDSIQVNQPIDSLIAKEPKLAEDPLFSKKRGQDLVTIVRILEVYKDEASAQAVYEQDNIASFNKQPAIADQRKKDEAAIETYLQANNIKTTRTPWGAYVQTISQGDAQKAKYGQFIMIRYTGKDFSGKEFDSNNKPNAPLLPLQVGAGGSILGFEDGVKQLGKGGKGIIYLPSVIAYGAQGSPPRIQPNQNLIFEIEVVDITDKQPAPQPMPPIDTTRK